MTSPAIDTDRLVTHLRETRSIDVSSITQLHDGLNLSLLVETANGDQLVIRRPNKFRDTPLFTDIAVERTILEHLEETAVPAPRPIAYVDDEAILDGPFLVISYIEGEPVSFGEELPNRLQRPDARNRFATELIDTLATIHALDVDPFEACCSTHTPVDQVNHASDRLAFATQSTDLEVPRLWDLIDRVREAAPEPIPPRLIHGDFRPGNVLFATTDTPTVTGVLDWEAAKCADPRTELGYLLLRWRDPDDLRPALDELDLERTDADIADDIRRLHEHGMAPYATREGSPTRDELIERYTAATGIDIDDLSYFRAHAALLLAVVWADLHRYTVEHGQSSTREPYIRYMAALGHRLLDT